eukprot:1159680-Pelagomonas_calceolata.AAC.3
MSWLSTFKNHGWALFCRFADVRTCKARAALQCWSATIFKNCVWEMQEDEDERLQKGFHDLPLPLPLIYSP